MLGGVFTMWPSRSVSGPRTSKRWVPIAIIGMLAVSAGIALPQALPTLPESSNVAPSPNDPPTNDKLTYTPPAIPEAPDPKAMLTRLGFATAGVLGLCIATLWIGRRWFGAASLQQTAGSQLRLMESL